MLLGLLNTHAPATAALTAAAGAVLPFFPIAAVALPASVEVGVRVGKALTAAGGLGWVPVWWVGAAVGAGVLLVHGSGLAAFQTALATAAGGGGRHSVSFFSRPEVLGLAVVAGVWALGGPEGAVMGPLAVALLAACGVLLAESVKPRPPPVPERAASTGASATLSAALS